MTGWATRTRQLIENALGDSKADSFLEGVWGRWSEEGAEANKRWMKQRLIPLGDLIQEVDSLKPLELEPDFDGSEWVSKK